MNRNLLQKCESCEFRSVDRCRQSNRPIAAMGECPLEQAGRIINIPQGQQFAPVGLSATFETDRISREVTIGISAFRRPQAVVKQIVSIRRFYPTVRILVVDNGDEPADIAQFVNVEYVTLPFDAGLSACRNEMVRRLTTPYLMICDDDYVWIPAAPGHAGTDLGRLLEILDSEPDVGVAGGSLIEPKRAGAINRYWAQELYPVGGDLETRELSSPWQRSPSGAWYRRTDTIMNFGLFRAEMLADHPWDNELKLNEHVEYYYRVKQTGRWQVIVCPEVAARHEKYRHAEYQEFRGREKTFNPIAYAKMGIDDYCGMFWADPRLTVRGGPLGDRPNIILLTIGNTGSSPAVEMAMKLGWNCPDADETYAESVEFREINELLLEGIYDRDRALRFLKGMPQPWIIKDPRFLSTRDWWQPLIKPYRPLLLYVTRNRSDVLDSQERRGVRRQDAKVWYEARDRKATRIWLDWPWAKLQLDFDHIRAAASIIDENRPPRADHVA